MQLSIVATLYQSAGTLDEFYRRMSAAVGAITDSYEIVLVNDGSPDDSLARALTLHEQDDRVVVVDLARNFGHHRAMMAGLAHARGDLVFLIDSDLEEDPAWLGRFHAVLRERGVDVVYGVQESRKGGVLERLFGWAFYHTVNLWLERPIPPNIATVRLMTRRYVRALVAHRERTFAIAGLWMLTGFDQVSLPVAKRARGSSSYSHIRRAAALVNAITSFSARPLVYIFYLGILLLLASTSLAVYLVTARLMFGRYLEGWVSVFVSIWFLGGLTFFCLGVIGIYLSKVFEETKRRPYVIVRGLYRRSAASRT